MNSANKKRMRAKEALLSAERAQELLSYDPSTGEFRWRVGRGGQRAGAVAGNLDHRGYQRIKVDGRFYPSHRIAHLIMTGRWPSDEIDHENRQRADNCWTNLREATSQQNAVNRLRCHDPFYGISQTGKSRWGVHLKVFGEKWHLGTYPSMEDAQQSRDHVVMLLAEDLSQLPDEGPKGVN